MLKFLFLILLIFVVFYGWRKLETIRRSGVPMRRDRRDEPPVVDLERNPDTGAYEPRDRKDRERRD